MKKNKDAYRGNYLSKLSFSHPFYYNIRETADPNFQLPDEVSNNLRSIRIFYNYLRIAVKYIDDKINNNARNFKLSHIKLVSKFFHPDFVNRTLRREDISENLGASITEEDKEKVSELLVLFLFLINLYCC